MWEFCAVRQDTFYSHQDYEQVNFYKKSSLHFIGWSFRKCKIEAHLQLLKKGTFQPKLDKINLFYQHPQPLYDVMQKEIENLEFVQRVHFKDIDSLKNNGTRYLLLFDVSCEKICNSKTSVGIATAGRHGGLITIYIENSFFHQSILGRDIELQISHIVLFKSPRDVMQVTTLRAQLGLGSELGDCY